MLNHSSNEKASIWGYDPHLDGFILKSTCFKEKNTELCDSYGVKSNTRFLLNYGFIDPENGSKEYEFGLKFDNTFPLYEEKIKLFPNLSDAFISFRLVIDENDGFSELFGFLRFAMIHTQDDLRSLQVIQYF